MTQHLTGNVLVFDSGMGGLTVARELMALAPTLSVDYAADSGFFPYGDKSDAALRARLPKVAKALCQVARPDVFVIACNTASTLALDEVRAVLDIPVVGTVPAIKPAAALTRTGTIGLLATPGTVKRDYTAKLIEDFASETRVIMHGSVALVRMAEQIASGGAVALEAFRDAQSPLFEADGGDQIDTVVLACTHFPLIRGELAATVPHPVTLDRKSTRLNSSHLVISYAVFCLKKKKTKKTTKNKKKTTLQTGIRQTKISDTCPSLVD